ncbi:hypothetical protein GOP47_0014990 [Adiantum capillus-veneris]|uniref:Uncharacterized protein n=1 Tax=Adiantum capillus-veneris TaxID=13818 RepID=A0A9D4UND6_ADICA|nr:hypothetical protein GOP47_0014990 [Adiantum capillus-veneris]
MVEQEVVKACFGKLHPPPNRRASSSYPTFSLHYMLLRKRLAGKELGSALKKIHSKDTETGGEAAHQVSMSSNASLIEMDIHQQS